MGPSAHCEPVITTSGPPAAGNAALRNLFDSRFERDGLATPSRSLSGSSLVSDQGPQTEAVRLGTSQIFISADEVMHIHCGPGDSSRSLNQADDAISCTGDDVQSIYTPSS